MMKTLHVDNWSLYFDGKRLDQNWYGMLVVKNEQREVKLKTEKRIPFSKKYQLFLTNTINGRV